MSMCTLLPMKNSRRLAVLGRNQIMVRFQDSRVLRFVARAAFLAVVIVCFPWCRAGNGAVMKTWEASFLPELLRDLNGIGLLTPDANCTVFLGDHSSQIPHVVENRVVEPFRIPYNFRIVYNRRFSSTVIAMRKVAEAPGNIFLNGARIERQMGRRLLSVPEAKMEALNGLEDVALEPPAKGRLQPHRLTRYLPDLLGDSLVDYRRRVFVDVGPAGRPGSELWFTRQYPTRNLDFEIIRVDVNDVISTGDSPASTVGGARSMTEWLRRNVREEDFVVMKAEAETVEEIVKGRAIALVDELFLECQNQWQKEKGGVKSRRAYWECLALYGKLRDEGVAVHQWWD